MKTYLDCVPCLLRNALDTVRFVTTDEEIHEKVLRKAIDAAGAMDYNTSPPAMAQEIQRTIRRLTGCPDPFQRVKEAFNRFALGLYPGLKEKIRHAERPLETAVRFAIAGNIIDIAAKPDIDPVAVQATIDQCLAQPLIGSMDAFAEAVQTSRQILYIGDNAGEIVFDRLLIEALPHHRLTYAVRGKPILNDATLADAESTGMTALVRVIDNGSDAPGTILASCSEAFQEAFSEADLVIAKGQGNYETLSDVQKKIVFMLKIKCPVVARCIGSDLGSLVIHMPDCTKD